MVFHFGRRQFSTALDTLGGLVDARFTMRRHVSAHTLVMTTGIIASDGNEATVTIMLLHRIYSTFPSASANLIEVVLAIIDASTFYSKRTYHILDRQARSTLPI